MLALACSYSFPLQAAPEKGSTAEKKVTKDWACEPVEGLPNVLILGDSISIGYTLQVRELLKGKANVYRPVNKAGTKPVNCSGTTDGLKRCGANLKAREWDVIHFNWGLHDLKHVKKAGTHQNSNNPKDPTQASPEVYGKNLQKIVDELKKTGAKLVFATTTPVTAGTTGPLRKVEAPGMYNEVALKVMEKNKIQVNDLYAYTLPHLAKWQLPKNVHFKGEGSMELAKKVAAVIGEKLDKK
ncbi:MAG: SGNH/GDSL hydrolase family protein [Akkermansiaceae bacterium]